MTEIQFKILQFIASTPSTLDKPVSSLCRDAKYGDWFHLKRRSLYSSVSQPPGPGTGSWHQLYRAARDSPGNDISYFMNKCFIVEIF